MKQRISLQVNGGRYELDVTPNRLLLDVLRDELSLTGARRGCEDSICGACTVLLDGRSVHACSVLAVRASGHNVLTIEGLAQKGRLHPLQESFIHHGAIQCGYCTPGMILAAKALLAENSKPTEQEVRSGLIGNLCRCTGYVKIVQAVLAAAQRL
jgi:aerobic carbon-monoxide dehydrogenase small subunit